MSNAGVVERERPSTSFIQSEVGSLPSDWHVVNLGELLVRPPSYGINAPAVPFDLRFPAYIRITDITDDGRFNPDGRASLIHPNVNSYRLEAGDIVLARTGASTGKSYLYSPDDGELVFAGFLIRVSPDPQKLLSTYLRYQLQTPIYWDWVRKHSMRSGQPGINGKQYASLPIPLPSTKREQQAIAEALSDADALIEGLEKLIAKKRLIKQGAMQELLTGKRRLPGFAGCWETKRLAEIGEVKTGLTYSPANVSPYGTLVLRSSNIQEDRLAFLDNVYVDVEVSDEATVRAGDLLICVRNGSRQLIGKTAMIDERANGMAFGAFMCAYRSEMNYYLIWCFQSSVVQEQFAAHLGATINQITNKTLNSVEVPIPTDNEERNAIAKILFDMGTEIQVLEARLSKARQIKQGLMQELLTGRMRLV